MTYKSYGIITYKRSVENNLEFLLVKNRFGGHWGFPKGTPEDGEMEIETAKREFEEETGIKTPEELSKEFFIEEYNFDQQGDMKYKINKFF